MTNQTVRKQDSKKRRQFTLIELLVVIAIISILMAILLPALKAAKDSAKSIACVSNLKQISTAIIMYTDAYNEFMPTGQGAGAGGQGAWIVQFRQFTNGNSKVFSCPGNVNGTDFNTLIPISGGSENVSMWAPNWVGYGYNELAFHTIDTQGFKKINKVTEISKVCVLVEQDDPDAHPYYSGYFGRFEFRHGAGGRTMNVLFGDTHVDIRTMLEIPQSGDIAKPRYDINAQYDFFWWGGG